MSGARPPARSSWLGEGATSDTRRLSGRKDKRDSVDHGTFARLRVNLKPLLLLSGSGRFTGPDPAIASGGESKGISVEFALLPGLIGLGIPIRAIVALVKVLNLRDELRGLERRLAAVEGRGGVAPPSAAAATAAPTAAPAPEPQPAAKETPREAVREPEKPAP